MNEHRAPIDRDAARALAAQRLNERRNRVRKIRNRGIAGAAATFVLAWGVVFGQLASGHDPALAASSSTSNTTSDTSTSTNTVNDSTTSTESSDTYSTSSDSGTTSSDDGNSSSSSPSAVTTSQS